MLLFQFIGLNQINWGGENATFLAWNFQAILFSFMQLVHPQLITHTDVMWRIVRLMTKKIDNPNLLHFNILISFIKIKWGIRKFVLWENSYDVNCKITGIWLNLSCSVYRLLKDSRWKWVHVDTSVLVHVLALRMEGSGTLELFEE